jgi:hypothetical protein
MPFGFGTGAECVSDCPCEPTVYQVWHISLECDCGTSGAWAMTGDFIPPNLACTYGCPTRKLPAIPDDRRAA